MSLLIDSNIWIDFTRPKSSLLLKRFLAPFILDLGACLTEPIVFEVLRHATPAELADLKRHFATLLLLPTPPDIWERASKLGRQCRGRGFTADPLDLLIAAVAQVHDAEIVTLDADFKKIEAITGLRVRLLVRP